MKGVEKIKTHILGSVTFYKNRAVYEMTVAKYGTAEQATADIIIRRMRFTCWTNKTRIKTNTRKM